MWHSLQRSDCSDVEKSVLKGKRDLEFGSVRTRKFLSERENCFVCFERETLRDLQGDWAFVSRLPNTFKDFSRADVVTLESFVARFL